jgi:hypothetical protein
MPFDFFVDTELSPRQALLPSGTLWLRDCIIARTGDQFYHRSELWGVDDVDDVADRNGMVRVSRDAEQVFDQRSMSSFEGAPITLGHPDMDVGPDTWRELSVGHAQNIRRVGDHLVADLLIHDIRGIRAVRDLGWRGLSAGYMADYKRAGRGLLQIGITGNHIAILSPSEQARCGAACRVGDAQRGKTMRRSRDSVMSEHRAWTDDPWKNRSGVMGDRPGSVGPQIIARMPVPASGCSLGTDPTDGSCLVWWHGNIGQKIDMPAIASGTAPLPRGVGGTFDAETRRVRERDADAAWSKRTLQGINEANRRFWAQNSGKA